MIKLPRYSKEKKSHYISYSQITSWKDMKSFNMGVLGKYEYMLSYFMGNSWLDQGWGAFGEDVENYICYGSLDQKEIKKLDKDVLKHNIKRPDRKQRLISDSINSFDDREKGIMNKIEPLGTFQQEGWIDFDGFKVLLYIDDATEDFKKIRDYKTASKKSGEKYNLPEYKQLDIYSLWVEQEYGYIPEELEVCIIERGGNCYGMEERRDLLTVKGDVWYINRETSKERLEALKLDIQKTAEEISKYYKIFLKLKKLV